MAWGTTNPLYLMSAALIYPSMARGGRFRMFKFSFPNTWMPAVAAYETGEEVPFKFDTNPFV